MNSKLGRCVISALCVGITFCLAAIATQAQDYQRHYQVDDALDGPQDVANPDFSLAL